MEERDKKLLELVVENPDALYIKDRTIKEIFSEEGSLYQEMNAYIKKKDLLHNIKFGYHPSLQMFTEIQINFNLKRKKNSHIFTIMYYTGTVIEDNTKKTANCLELLKDTQGVQRDEIFKFVPSFSCWSEVWWNKKHPVYELEHKLYEDGFEEEFLDKAKEIFAFVEKALKS